jgi:hypothetical protein
MIKIEVIGNSIPEVADKLIAIGCSLQQPVMHRITNATAVDAAQVEEITTAAAEIAQTKRSRKPKAEEVVAEPVVEEVEVEEAVVEEAVVEAVSTLDYTKHVMPAVLRAVETQGRERVVALLGSMGVDKASQLPESRWPELMKALNA